MINLRLRRRCGRKWLNWLLSISLVLLLSSGGTTYAALDDLQDLLSDARPSTAANHTFTIDQGSTENFQAGETIVIDFVDADGWDTSALASTDALDYDFAVGGVEQTVVDSNDTCTDDEIQITTVNTSTDTLIFTACSGYTAGSAGEEIVIKIGTHATVGGTGNSQIVNPTTTGTKQINVDTTDAPAKDTAVVIIGGVTMSATVDEVLTHTTAGVTTANCPNPAGAGSETEIDTSGDATTVPFGTINVEAFYGACQQLTVTTNASLGYTTTLKTTTRPTSGSNVINEGNCDGSCSDTTEAAWATATNNGYGYCASDQNGDPASTADSGWSAANNGCNSSGTTFFKTINRADAGEPGQNIMQSPTPVSGDSAYIKYRLSVDGTQQAGTYTTTIIYVTTATF